MKRRITKTVHSITLSLFVFCFLTNINAQHNTSELPTSINANGAAPDASAMLDVQSTNKGILIPRLSNTSAVANPVEGLMIYDNSVNAFQYYDGISWYNTRALKYISFPDIGNSFLGFNAGASHTFGDFNTVMGYEAMFSNTTGHQNAAFGWNTLHDNTTGDSNMAIGSYALFRNTTGYQNLGIGSSALAANTTGNQNVALGNRALYSNTTGYSNVAIGVHALYDNINLSNLVAVGDSALYSNTHGTGNTAVGSKALYLNTYGSNNTAVGKGALSDYSVGDYNTAIGKGALQFNGANNDYNTAVGANTYIGAGGTGEEFLDYYNSTVIGYQAEAFSSGQVRIGNYNVFSIGGYVDWSTISDARFKKQVQNNVPGLAFISLLNPVTYQMDMDAIAKHHRTPDSLRLAESERAKAAIRYTGFLAQEVEKAAESVGYDFSGVDAPQHKRDNYSLRYAEFVVPLVKAVQELEAENKTLRAQHADMEARLGKIEALLRQRAE